jgi:hypothetical protein
MDSNIFAPVLRRALRTSRGSFGAMLGKLIFGLVGVGFLEQGQQAANRARMKAASGKSARRTPAFASIAGLLKYEARLVPSIRTTSGRARQPHFHLSLRLRILEAFPMLLPTSCARARQAILLVRREARLGGRHWRTHQPSPDISTSRVSTPHKSRGM